MISMLRTWWLRFVVLLGSMSLAGAVIAMTVQPVVINLTTSGRGMTQTFTVENTFANPLPVEIRSQQLTLSQDGVQASGTETNDLMVFPAQAMIQPGQTQTFRVQYVGDPDLAASRHYYVTVAQLPVQMPQGQSAIQILYNFQVLVSVSAAGARPAITVNSAAIDRNAAGQPVPALTVTNGSAAHGYLSNGRIRIVQRDASGREIFRRTLPGPELQQTIGFGLIGSGQTRRVIIPVELPSSEGTVEAQFTPDR